MAFYLFTGDTDEVFPSLGLTARPGFVYDLGNAVPPAEPLLASGVRPTPATRWESHAGPATDFLIRQASDVPAVGGVPVVRAFPFAFDTPNLLTGATVYTPTVGDLLIDAWVQIDTPWNGTAPTGDVSTFVGINQGLFGYLGYPWNMTYADNQNMGGGLLNNADGVDGASALSDYSALDTVWTGMRVAAVESVPVAAQHLSETRGGCRTVPLKFAAANPIKVCVSQDGTNNGADPESAQGSAVLYLVTCTPAAA